MATIINADVSTGGAIITGDGSGTLALQAAGVTKLTVNGSGVTLASALPVASGGTGATSLSGITVGTATNATNATTATNLAGGSNGTIPYQSASGTTQMLAVGSSGQVLKSNGVAAPSWVTPSAGALNYLSTVTASNSATVDVESTFNSTYNVYMLTGTNIRSASNGTAMHLQMKIGGAYITTGSSYLYHQNYSGSDSAAYGGTSSAGLSYIVLAIGLNSNASNTYNFVMYIYNPSSTTVQKVISSTGTNIAGNPTFVYRTANCSGGNTGTGALTGLRFFCETGNIATGTFRLYGVSDS